MSKRAPSRGQYDRAQLPEERRADTRARILAAALEVVTVRGLADASVEHVVRVAGVSRRTFYETFKDLPQVLIALHHEAANLLFHSVEAAVIAAPDDPLSRIRVGVDAFFRTIMEHADFARVALQQLRGSPEHDAVRELGHGRYIALFIQEVAKAHAAGIASRAPDELTIYAIVSGMESVALRHLARREESRLMEAGPSMMELLVRAFI